MPAELFSSVRRYVDDRIAEFHQIPSERQQELLEIARYVTACRKATQPARLTFICTHNSRRSHLSQIWAALAADFYGIAGVETYSGGTEATAFAKAALAALRRVGFCHQFARGEKSASRAAVPVDGTITDLLFKGLQRSCESRIGILCRDDLSSRGCELSGGIRCRESHQGPIRRSQGFGRDPCGSRNI